MNAAPPLVSVVIPARGSGAVLRTCLQCLAAQSLSPSRFEVIVVDDGVDRDVAGLLSTPYPLTVLDAELGGDPSRNKGIAAARGAIIAFTDADCLPSPTWLERGVDAFAAHDVDVLAGKINVTRQDPFSPVERFEGVLAFQQQTYVRRYGFGVFANLFVKRDVFERVGMLDTELAACGDLEWGKRASSSGVRMRYEASAEVAHPARASKGALMAKQRRTIAGHHVIRVRHPRWRVRIPLALIRASLDADEVRTILRSSELRSARERLTLLLLLFEVRWARLSHGLGLWWRTLRGIPLPDLRQDWGWTTEDPSLERRPR